MTTIRQDAWHEQDDLALSETVLRHIRTGSTQLAAFEDAANALSRTPAACGFRWNSEVRKRYENGIREARTQRHAMKNQKGNQKELVSVSMVTLESPEVDNNKLNYLDQIVFVANKAKRQNENMATQIKSLNEENQQLRAELEKYKEGAYSSQTIVNDDYKDLLRILEKARKTGALDALGSQNAVV